MRENRKVEAIRWLTQAEEELKDAAYLTKAGRYYLSLFLCQQSAIRTPGMEESMSLSLWTIAQSVPTTFHGLLVK